MVLFQVIGGTYVVALVATKGFRALRRRALRALLVDLAPVLMALADPAVPAPSGSGVAARRARPVSWWIDFGTLLGVHREGDLIPYDNDVDVCLLWGDADDGDDDGASTSATGASEADWAALRAALEAGVDRRGRPLLRGGRRVAVVHPSEDQSVTWLRVVALGGIAVVDLYGATRPSGGGTDRSPRGPDSTSAASASSSSRPVVGVDIGRGDVNDVPADLVLPLARRTWRAPGLGRGGVLGIGRRGRDVVLSVPADVEGVLAWRYGDDWRTPRYLDKGRDTVEGTKLYFRLFRMLGMAGLRL